MGFRVDKRLKELIVWLVCTAMFTSFLFIEEGKIGRLWHFNAGMLVFSLVMTAKSLLDLLRRPPQ